MSTYGVTNNSAANNYSPQLSRVIARLPQVKLVESWVGVGVLPLEHDGAPNLNPSINPAGSVDGLYFDEDRATPVVGRMADPGRADEFVTTALGARTMGWHVDQIIPMGLYSSNQFGLPGFGTPSCGTAAQDRHETGRTRRLQQPSDRGRCGPPPHRRPVHPRPDPHTASPPIPSRAPGTPCNWLTAPPSRRSKRSSSICSRVGAMPTSLSPRSPRRKVERAVKPESIALGVFGAIAALAALAIGALAISRVLGSAED